MLILYLLGNIGYNKSLIHLNKKLNNLHQKYDGEDIEWVSNKEWKKHKKRIEALGAIKQSSNEEDDDDTSIIDRILKLF